jgi:hypothetical protein
MQLEILVVAFNRKNYSILFKNKNTQNYVSCTYYSSSRQTNPNVDKNFDIDFKSISKALDFHHKFSDYFYFIMVHFNENQYLFYLCLPGLKNKIINCFENKFRNSNSAFWRFFWLV